MGDLIGGVDEGTNDFLVSNLAGLLIRRQNHITGLGSYSYNRLSCDVTFILILFPSGSK